MREMQSKRLKQFVFLFTREMNNHFQNTPPKKTVAIASMDPEVVTIAEDGSALVRPDFPQNVANSQKTQQQETDYEDVDAIKDEHHSIFSFTTLLLVGLVCGVSKLVHDNCIQSRQGRKYDKVDYEDEDEYGGGVKDQSEATQEVSWNSSSSSSSSSSGSWPSHTTGWPPDNFDAGSSSTTARRPSASNRSRLFGGGSTKSTAWDSHGIYSSSKKSRGLDTDMVRGIGSNNDVC
jgi:hypothetical protein